MINVSVAAINVSKKINTQKL